MSSDSLLVCTSEHRRCAWICLNLLIAAVSRLARSKYKRGRTCLIGDEDCDVELLADPGEAGEHLVQLLLSLGQLSPPRIVDSEQRHDRIDNLKAWAPEREGRGEEL